jgi:hypothetical protein
MHLQIKHSISARFISLNSGRSSSSRSEPSSRSGSTCEIGAETDRARPAELDAEDEEEEEEEGEEEEDKEEEEEEEDMV